MKYKLFEEYIENGHPGFFETEKEIHAWLEQNDGKYYYNVYTINDDWSVDVNGNVNISNEWLTYIRIKFNEVKGYFDCNGNNLKSLEGVPDVVTGIFDCSGNDLVTLEGGPGVVKGDFNCRRNPYLISFGHKSTIKGEFKRGTLIGTLSERWERYIDGGINYIETLDGEDKKSSLQWLYDVDEDFRELVVRYAAYNDIDLPGVNMDIATDASKHKDSGLF